MADSVAGVVLAAGAGTRLHPLTLRRPKALCPVGGVALVDRALGRIAPVTTSLAVNLHHHAERLDRHLGPGVHRSWERTEALGTAGALGALRPWIDGRDVVVTNSDAWFARPPDVADLVATWDRERVRLLCVPVEGSGDFGGLRYCGVALLPWGHVERMAPVPSGLYEVSWAAERAAGRLDLVAVDGGFTDCGTPARYLAANLEAVSAGCEAVDARWPSSAVDRRAEVSAEASIVRSVVWEEARVGPGEHLVDAVRGDGWTVLVR